MRTPDASAIRSASRQSPSEMSIIADAPARGERETGRQPWLGPLVGGHQLGVERTGPARGVVEDHAARRRPSEGPGHAHDLTGPCAGAQDRCTADGHPADDRHSHDGLLRAGDVAPDDRAAAGLGQLFHRTVELADLRGPQHAGRARQADNRRDRLTAHGGDVRQVDRQRRMPDVGE